MKRKDDMDKWLKDRIDEDLMAMADEREKLLMESGELQDVEMPQDMLEKIHRRIEAQNHAVRKVRIRRRMVVVVAAAAISCVGMGLIGYGNRVYEPEIIEREIWNETTMKINNSDVAEREYVEEEVCQEIQEKLGVVPVKLGYRPKGMRLVKYDIVEGANEALVKYKVGENTIHVYISKDYSDSSINFQTDVEKLDTIIIKSKKLEIEVLEYQDPQNRTYYLSSFKYLNTFYSVYGRIDQDEFIKILEDIILNDT